MKKILLVEDDLNVVHFIRKGLEEEGYEVSVALDARMGEEMAKTGAFDLLVLDIMLPDGNGLELCRKIRSGGINLPVLFLTALNTAENIAHGLDSGGDDYLVKPFKFIELLARIKALMRRAAQQSQPADQPAAAIYTVADLKVDDEAKTVTRNGLQISLTATEYRLLLSLIKNKNKVMNRMDLLEAAWDINFNLGTNVVDVYINYLRKKIDQDASAKLIHTVIGMGYVIREA